MATSLFSDFTPIPQILNAHMAKAFVQRSFELLQNWVSEGGDAPIRRVNRPEIAAKGGQYTENPYFKRAITANKRDVTSTSSLTAAKLEGGNNKGVLLHRRTNLIEFSDDVWIAGVSMESVNAELGRQSGEMIADDCSQILIAAMIGMVQAVTASAHTKNVWNASSRTNHSPTTIDQGRFLLGDAMGKLTHLLARSEVKLDLSSDAISRAYDAVAGAHLQGNDGKNNFGFKRAYVDDANLTTADAGFDKYTMLLAGAGLMRFGFVKPVAFEMDRDISKEVKVTQFRGDYDLVVESDHMGWNSGAGGANPAVSGLATSANWSVGYENHKELPLVEVIANYSGN